MNKKEIRFPAAAIFLLLAAAIRTVLSTELSVRVFGVRMHYNFQSVLMYIVPLVLLAVVLMTKNRGFVLVGALAINAAIGLLDALRGIGVIYSLCDLLSYLLLVAMALCCTEKAKVKISVLGKLWFVPGLLQIPTLIHMVILRKEILREVFRVIFRKFRFIAMGQIMVLLPYICLIIGLLALGRWLVKGEKKVAAEVEYESDSGESYATDSSCFAFCGLIKHILLLSFTFGIWYLVWMCRTTKYLNRAPGSKKYSAGGQLLLCLFIPFYQIFWYYKQGQRVDSLSRERGVTSAPVESFSLFCGIFMPIMACIVLQDRINTLCIGDE